MGTFNTGTGQTGFASEGFRATGKNSGVTAIYSGKKKIQGSKLIYKKGQSPAPIKKEEPINSTITTPTGETVQVTKKEGSNYPAVRVAQSFRKDLTTEQAQRIASQIPERRYIAVSTEDINRVNSNFANEGYNAKKLIEGMNQGNVTINPEGTITIKENNTQINNTSNAQETPPPPEAVEYLDKKYYGVEDYFQKLTASGLIDVGTGTADIILNKRLNTNNIFLIARGKIKTGLGFSGVVASSIIESILWLPAPSRYKNGIPEQEVSSDIYKAIQEKEQSQKIAGAIQLSALTQGIKINPSEATPVKSFTKLETSPYEPPSDITITEPNGERFIIKAKGIQPETPGNKLASGLIPSKEAQTQIYPKTLTEERSIFAPAEADLPSARELENVFGKKYQSSFGINPEGNPSVKPQEIFKVFRNENPPETQQALKNYITVTSKKAPAQIPEEIVIIQSGQKKGIIFGKKAQSTVNPFGELETDNSGRIFEAYKPGENNIFKPGNLETGNLNNEENFKVFIPEATRNEYNFNTGNKNFNEVINSAKINFITENDINTGIKSITDTGTRQGTRGRIRSVTIPQTIQITEQAQQEETPRQIFNPTKINNPYKLREPPKEEPINPGLPKIRSAGKKEKNPNSQGYNVFVKSKGIFNKINNKPLNLSNALKKGAEKVENSASATFKITNPENPGGIFTNTTPEGFYKKGNLFIEKPSRRLNTLGEMFEIRSKAITSKKIKKLYGGIK